MMKDQIWLLLCGLGCAIAAWAYWHYLDTYAAPILILTALVSLLADNIRLRRKLRETGRKT